MQQINRQDLINDFIGFPNKKNKRKIYNGFGLYFLFSHDQDLIYIGYSHNVRNRLKRHIDGNTNTKRFSNEIEFIHIYPDEEFDEIRNNFKINDGVDIEFFLIKYFNPKYNIK